MTKLSQDIFDAFMEQAPQSEFRHKGFGQSKKHRSRIRSFKEKIIKWSQIATLESFDLDAEVSGGYKRACVVAFNKRYHSKQYSFPVFLTVIKEDTGELSLLSLKMNTKSLSLFLKNSHISKTLSDYKKDPYPLSLDFSLSPLKMKITSHSLNDLHDLLDAKHKRIVSDVRKDKALFNGLIGLFRNKRVVDQQQHVLSQIIDNTLKKYLNQLISSYMSEIDLKSLAWAKEVSYNFQRGKSQTYYEIAIFNKIIEASSYEARAYRYTAMEQFAYLGSLFWDQDIWNDIDNGQPPFQILANHMNVNQSTLKHMAKMLHVFSFGDDTKNYAEYLDKIDPSLWPQDKEQLSFFKIMMGITDAHSNAFTRSAPDVLKDWVKNNPKKHVWDQSYSWSELTAHILKKQIHRVLREYSSFLGNKPENVDAKDFYSYNLFVTAVKRYKDNISNIKDMKSDVWKKLILPQLIVSIEKNGFKVNDTDAINDLNNTISQNLWNKMPPSDQISASSYWHSGDVNIKRRFKSAVLHGASDYKEWEGLFGDNPYQISKNIFIHPLNSSVKLEEESDMMTSEGRHHRFCIWSYGSYHFTRNYHMMSVRDEQGNRICSLTVEDYFNGMGERKVKFSQNKAKDNQTPCDIGTQTAAKVLEIVNEGDFKPDWRKIDSVRADYKANEIKNAAGYDFYDAEQVQAVLDVYLPCLPKKLFSGQSKTLDTFIQGLDLDNIVKEFLNDFDFSQGGLIKIENDTVLQNRSQQHRPKVA